MTKYFSLTAIRVLAQSLHDVLCEVEANRDVIRHKFLAMLEVSLWGNKCDLSISAGSAKNFSNDPLEQVYVHFYPMLTWKLLFAPTGTR